MNDLFRLDGKVALVTGASYGIGFAIASALAEAGATIVFNDIKQELVDKGVAAYAEQGITAHGYVCDVTDEEQVNAFVKQVTEEVGHINILVNNAGIIKRIPMCEMTAAEFRQVIDIDLNGPFIMSKAVIPDMIAQGGGKIINPGEVDKDIGVLFRHLPAAVGGAGVRNHKLCGHGVPQGLKGFQAPLDAADVIFKNNPNGYQGGRHSNFSPFRLWGAWEKRRFRRLSHRPHHEKTGAGKRPPPS